jgi:hypothetical protein
LRRGSAATAILLAALGAAAPAAPARTVRLDGPGARILEEPGVAVDPSAPNRVVVVVKDTQGSGDLRIDRFVSTDGGRTFGPRRRVANATYGGVPALVSDPVVDFDGAGHAFFGALAIRFYPDRNRFDSVIGVRRSDDGGGAFGPPALAVRDEGPGLPEEATFPPDVTWNDKDWLAVDRRSGTLYEGWNRIRTRFAGQSSRIAVSRSTDGGATFSPPLLLSPPRGVTTGPQVAVRGDGAVEVAWVGSPRPVAHGDVFVAVSHDGGITFGAPRRVGRVDDIGRTAYDLAALAATGSTSLACWGSAGRARCARAVGDTWRAPRLVDRHLGGLHDLIAVTADDAGRYWLGMYAIGRRGTTVRLYRSADAGRTFRFVRILARRPYAAGGFLPGSGVRTGDYFGLAAVGGRVTAAYVLPRRGHSPLANSVYVTTVPAR